MDLKSLLGIAMPVLGIAATAAALAERIFAAWPRRRELGVRQLEVAKAVGVGGGSIRPLPPRRTVTRSVPVRAPAASPGQKILLGFVVLFAVLGVTTIALYWPEISANRDTMLFAVWLFVTMIFGMFVQVVVANYQAGKAMFDVTVPDLVLPLFFSLVVYYSIWSVASSAPHSLFSFYAAFLNGYFWRNVLASAKLPTAQKDG